MSRNRTPKSPYARGQKKPFRYSDLHREITELVRKTGSSDTERILELRQEHAAKFGYSLGRVELQPEQPN